MGCNEFRKHQGRRKVAFLGHFEENGPVLLLPKKLLPYRMETEGLVELKIKGDKRHTYLSQSKRKIKSYIEEYAMKSNQNQSFDFLPKNSYDPAGFKKNKKG